MSLQAGHKLAHYEILEPIGRGGMGEVYRAKDSKLGRDVAIKVLPDEFAQDEERLRRFQREAKVLASLNHPNIAAIHGLEQSGDTHYLVLELVPGETLADRIARGPIPVEEALEIATKIAEALEEAHERGIVHRDLKPANVKLTEDGKVKVLDFGLAKAFAEEGAEGDAATSMSPTITRDATRVGVILGTAAYMSPEQAKGKRVDKRTDIFAFGAVLFEMLTGKKAFPGDDVSDVLAAIIRAEPDWSAVPSQWDPRIHSLLNRCLEKDNKKRLRDIGDVRNEMEAILAEPAAAANEAPPAISHPSRVRERFAWGLAVLVAGIVVWNLTPRPARPVARFVLGTPTTEPFRSRSARDVAISPDGARVAYGAGATEDSHLYLRPVDRLDGTRLFDAPVDNPFFSPDGAWIGFGTPYDLTWKKVSVLGGPAVTLFPATSAPRGASWGVDGTIVFANYEPGTGLMRGSAAGGEPELLTTPDTEQGELGHRWPEILPGGEAVLFNIVKENGMEIAVLDLATTERKVLVPNGSNPHYSPTGHIVYGVDGTLLAVPFDLDRLELTGDPVPLLEGVMTDTSGAVEFSISADGSLVYVSGDSQSAGLLSLVWVDLDGLEEPVAAEARSYQEFTLSPDGTKLAVRIISDNTDVWICDLVRETWTRLTFDPAGEIWPVWTPDGQRVAFGTSGGTGMFWKAADGTGEAERLMKSDGELFPNAFSPDGSVLVFEDRGGISDLAMLSLEGERASTPLLTTPFNESNAALSPDGYWMAYQSDESGQYEVYVRPFPDVGAERRQVSSDGGTWPLWAPDGRELFYVGPEAMMGVSVEMQPTFSLGSRRAVFDTSPYYTRSLNRRVAIAPDGQRFLMLKEGAESEDTAALPTIVFVQNWFEELAQLVPTSH